jgi:beta-1,4-mannosyl-glycoprotein beta-1,4-N-acetylglucosaminyltransferase
MIFDCFPFFNELDLLEIRMHELDDAVDYFVLAESEKTHQGTVKPLYFADNAERFKAFESKVIWGNVLLSETDSWGREREQRDLIFPLIKDRAKPGDIIILSDMDEIPRAKKILEVLSEPDFQGPVEMDPCLFYYHLNGLASKSYGSGPVVCRFEQIVPQFGGLTGLKLAGNRGKFLKVRNGAWHFSWIGGVEKVTEKIRACAHDELNNSNLLRPEKIREIIDGGVHITERSKDRIVQYVPIDETFPRYVFNNQEKFSHLIHEVG